MRWRRLLCVLLAAACCAVGAMQDAQFHVLQWQLSEQDRLVLITDGVIEAQDADGRLFGFERAEDLIRHRVTAALLADAAQSFGQTDDITVLSLELQIAVGEPARVLAEPAVA